MKTTKNVNRSPIQMTIVAFVVLFFAITATILFMYFKWFANDELGAPAAVNVVVEENVAMEETEEIDIEDESFPQNQDSFILTDDELFQNLYGYREWPQDKIDLIKVADGCQVLGSILSHSGDQLVYFEKCGITSKLILLNLTSKQEKLLYSKDVVNEGYNTFDYVPQKWSPQDKKIILQIVVGSVDLGQSHPEGIIRIIDAKSGKREIFAESDSFVGFWNDASGNENLIYLASPSTAFCPSLIQPYNKLIKRNAITGKETILVESEKGGYAHLNDKGELSFSEAVPREFVEELNCIDAQDGGVAQLIPLN
jgi:hypothetical protein